MSFSSNPERLCFFFFFSLVSQYGGYFLGYNVVITVNVSPFVSTGVVTVSRCAVLFCDSDDAMWSMSRVSCTEFGSEVKETSGDTDEKLEDLLTISEVSATEDVTGSDEKVEFSACSVRTGVHDTRFSDGVSENCGCSLLESCDTLVASDTIVFSGVKVLAEIFVVDPWPDALPSVGNAGCEFKEAPNEKPGSWQSSWFSVGVYAGGGSFGTICSLVSSLAGVLPGLTMPSG